MSRGARAAPDLAAVLLLVLCSCATVLLVGLGGDYPLNDDWAYAYSARHLLETGQFRVLDWAAPGLLGHVLWGAALLRWLGDSYVVLRGGTLAFALAGVLLCYALARQCGLGPRRGVLCALALGLSPWYVNLSFTYMTDVPWLVTMLGALCCALAALPPERARPRPVLLVLSGVLVGFAALTRQFAIITTPAFLLYLALDARRREGAAFHAAAAARGALFLLPVLLIFVPFQIWYSRVHGATVANRETWQRIREVTWHPLEHAIVILHYFGLFLAPLALSLVAARRRVPLGRTARGLVLATLGVYAVIKGIAEEWSARTGDAPFRHHQTMPYLDNIFYRFHLGPPTIYDVYMGTAPTPRESLFAGVVLTLMTIVSGLWAAALLWPRLRDAARDTAALLRPRSTSSPPPPPLRARQALLLGFAACYLLWHLGTGPFLFDRYLLPVLPVAWILALHESAAAGADERWAPLVGIAIVGALSMIGTREYMSWNAARDHLVRALEARGVPAEDLDGGFEVNGPRRFAAYFHRTGKLFEDDGSWWARGAHHRISFWPAGPGCRTLDEAPYFSVPAPRRMYLVLCPGPQGN